MKIKFIKLNNIIKINNKTVDVVECNAEVVAEVVDNGIMVTCLNSIVMIPYNNIRYVSFEQLVKGVKTTKSK